MNTSRLAAGIKLKQNGVSCYTIDSVLFLLAAVAVFHLANAPILPVTALYIKQLGGSSALTTFTVLSAQMVMVPVAWACKRVGDRSIAIYSGATCL